MPGRRAGSPVAAYARVQCREPKQDSKRFNSQVRWSTLPIWVSPRISCSCFLLPGYPAPVSRSQDILFPAPWISCSCIPLAGYPAPVSRSQDILILYPAPWISCNYTLHTGYHTPWVSCSYTVYCTLDILLLYPEPWISCS